jgi:hypothetical protein
MDNLNDHLRRVHGITEEPPLQNIAKAASDLVEAPLLHLPDMGNAATELQQLNADGVKQDERIRTLENNRVQSEARLKSIERTLERLPKGSL